MLNTLDITKYISACAKRADVRVVWQDVNATPATDGRTMWLPSVDAYAADTQIVHLRQFVKHETSHVLLSDFDLLNKNKPNGLLAFVNNLLEDHRIDYLNDSTFTGDKYNTEAYWKLYCALLKSKPPEGEARDHLLPLFVWDTHVRDDLWSRSDDPFTCNVSAKGHTYLDKLNKGDYANVLRNVRTIVDKTEGGIAVYELAKRIIREVFDTDPAKMEGGEGKTGEGGGGKGTKEIATIDYKGKMVLPYSEHADRGEGVNATNYKCGAGAYTPDAYDNILTWNFGTKEGSYRVSERDDRTSKYLRLADKGEALANQIRTQLQIICRDRWEYGKKRGKLHNGALYRVGMKDAKGLNERLFKEKIHNQSLDVCVQVLVDASGSMSGSTFDNASAAALILNKVLATTLHIPLEILAFTETGEEKHTMFIMKEFDKRTTTKSLATAFSSLNSHLTDNVDGESLMYGYNRIRSRKEKRKLMVVLSDGTPCGGHRKGNIDQYTEDVIKNIEQTPVSIVGVGVMYDAVKHYYRKWAYIEDAHEIESALLSLISNHIIRSV
jgi:hypothetical protein